jgi:hypothetical protein
MGNSDRDKAKFTNRVIRVSNGDSQRITKDRHCFLKGHPMFLEV